MLGDGIELVGEGMGIWKAGIWPVDDVEDMWSDMVPAMVGVLIRAVSALFGSLLYF